MANNSLNTVQVVVSNGIIAALHDFNNDLYDMYDHTAFAWFDYNNAAAGVGTDTNVTLTENVLTVDPDTGNVNVTQNSAIQPLTAGLADPRLTMTLANAKIAVISQLNRIQDHQIQAAYPIQTQLNIIRQGAGYSSGDLTNMSTAIDGIRSAIATKIAAVNALTTVNAVVSYNVWQ